MGAESEREKKRQLASWFCYGRGNHREPPPEISNWPEEPCRSAAFSMTEFGFQFNIGDGG